MQQMHFARVSHRGVPDERPRPHPHVYDTQTVQASNRFPAAVRRGETWPKRFRTSPATKGSTDAISQQQLDCVGNRREFLVPSKQSLSVGLAAMQQRLSRSNRARSSDRLSITVERLAARTAAPHGITGPELERLSGVVRFVTLHCRPRRSALWLATTNKGAARPAIADVWKRITRQHHGFSRTWSRASAPSGLSYSRMSHRSRGASQWCLAPPEAFTNYSTIRLKWQRRGLRWR